jgi:hypothetical protein
MKRGHWTPEEDRIAVAMSAQLSTCQTIADRLGRDANGVRRRLRVLAVLARDTAARTHWTADEDRLLESRLDAGESYDVIAARLHRSPDACRCRATVIDKRPGYRTQLRGAARGAA